MLEIKVNTSRRIQALDITPEVEKVVLRTGFQDGVAVLYVPHTTAGITINEGADPDVMRDVLEVLSKVAPESSHYRHMEGNADSHVKSTICGSSVSIIVEDGQLLLGTWQKIFFMEFDGPRTRKVWVKLIGR